MLTIVLKHVCEVISAEEPTTTCAPFNQNILLQVSTGLLGNTQPSKAAAERLVDFFLYRHELILRKDFYINRQTQSRKHRNDLAFDEPRARFLHEEGITWEHIFPQGASLREWPDWFSTGALMRSFLQSYSSLTTTALLHLRWVFF